MIKRKSYPPKDKKLPFLLRINLFEYLCSDYVEMSSLPISH
jgi:hypothetical protein